MASNWNVFNSYVRIGPAVGGIILPVSHMDLTPIPWTGTGSTVTELFDGRRIIEQPTWGYELLLTWDEIGSYNDILRDAILDILGNDGRDVYPVHQTGTSFDASKVLVDMIPRLDGGELKAIFEGRARKRPASLALVSKEFSDAVPLDWIND